MEKLPAGGFGISWWPKRTWAKTIIFVGLPDKTVSKPFDRHCHPTEPQRPPAYDTWLSWQIYPN